MLRRSCFVGRLMMEMLDRRWDGSRPGSSGLTFHLYWEDWGHSTKPEEMNSSVSDLIFVQGNLNLNTCLMIVAHVRQHSSNFWNTSWPIDTFLYLRLCACQERRRTQHTSTDAPQTTKLNKQVFHRREFSQERITMPENVDACCY